MNTAIERPSNLIVPSAAFSESRLQQQADIFGYAQANSLEALIWDYELYAQVQHRASESCRLKGGAAVQLFVPKECTSSEHLGQNISSTKRVFSVPIYPGV